MWRLPRRRARAAATTARLLEVDGRAVRAIPRAFLARVEAIYAASPRGDASTSLELADGRGDRALLADPGHRRAQRRAACGASRDITERRRAEEAAQTRDGGAPAAARERARGARRGRARERDEGRVPRHALARAAHAAQRDPRLVADAAAARAGPRRAAARARDDRAQRARPGAADRGPARHEPHHLRQDAARHPAGRPARGHRGGARDGAARGRGEGRSGSSKRLDPAAGPGRRRPEPPAAGRLEPAVERDQVHARRAAGSRSLLAARRARTSRSRVRRHRHRHQARVPAARLRALPPGGRLARRASTAGSASASRSSSSSSSCTAARSRRGERRARAAARRSPSACR